MKHTLGSLLFLFCSLYLHAEDFIYHLNINNPQPYVKEVVILDLELNQTNHNVVLIFDFDILPSPDYTFQRIAIQEDDAHHDISIRYTYLLYPLHDGEISINFKLTKKITTDDSVAYSFSGDRDNVKGLVTKDYTISLPSQPIHVKPLPKGTQIVGDFHLTHTLKGRQSKEYEALNLQLKIKGSGYPPLLENIIKKNDDFTLFTDEPLVQSTIVNQNTLSTITYPIALMAKKSFILHAIDIQAFNPQTHKSYTLHLDKEKFNIIKTKYNTLVDTIDSPPTLQIDFNRLTNFISYLLIFIVGFISAWILKQPYKHRQKKQNPLHLKIQNTKNAKSLLQLLLATDSHLFHDPIKQLENNLYAHGKINLNKLKKEAIKLI